MAGVNDIIDMILSEDEPSAKQHSLAAAKALRGEQTGGEIMSMANGMSGAPALGANMLKNAQEGENRAIQAAGVRETGLLRKALGFERASATRYGADRRADATKYTADRRVDLGKYTADSRANDILGTNESRERMNARTNQTREMIAQIMGNAKVDAAAKTQGVNGLLKFGKDMNPDTNPGLKPYRDVMFQADRLNALVTDPDGAIRNLNKAQMHELALGLHRMFTGGSRAVQAQVAALVPSSITGNINSFAEWFENNPVGLEQQEFSKLFLDTAMREKEVAHQGILRAQKGIAAAHAPTIQAFPDHAFNIMTSNGVDPEEAWNGIQSLGTAAIPGDGHAPAIRERKGPVVPPRPGAPTTIHPSNSVTPVPPQAPQGGPVKIDMNGNIIP